MSTDPSAVEQTVVTFLRSIDKLPEGFTESTTLYADGAGLDSLETAELSATLEDVHGSDPYSAGEMPQTLQDVLRFYAPASA